MKRSTIYNLSLAGSVVIAGLITLVLYFLNVNIYPLFLSIFSFCLGVTCIIRAYLYRSMSTLALALLLILGDVVFMLDIYYNLTRDAYIAMFAIILTIISGMVYIIFSSIRAKIACFTLAPIAVVTTLVAYRLVNIWVEISVIASSVILAIIFIKFYKKNNS